MIQSLLAMLFAGITSVLAKYGLANVPADLGLLIRTAAIFVLVVAASLWNHSYAQYTALTLKETGWLVASGITAFLSWLYYFRAIKDGLVTYVVAIDKASIVVTLVLSFILLNEPMKPRVILGAALIVAGLFILIKK